jgi:hypothetical protein
MQMQDPMVGREEECQVQDEIHSLLEQEEVKWKQWAKENWLKYGDRNTKFFIASANQKNRRSHIEQIWTKMEGCVLNRGKLKGPLFLISGLYLWQGKIWRWKLVQGLFREG